AVLARNAYSLEFGDRVAFLASDGDASSVTADRAEFLGRHGSVLLPEAVARGETLSGKVEAASDPCAALARDIEVPAGGSASVLLLLGDAASAEEATALVERHRGRAFDERLAATEAEWRDFLETLQVETPDPAFDAMVN